MTIYFYSNQKDQTGKTILAYLRKTGATVISNLSAISQEQDLSLEEVDAVVVQGDDLGTEASYFVALALSQNKHVLFLLSKKSAINSTLKALQKNKNFSDRVHIMIFNQADLQQKVLDFLQVLDQDSGRDIVSLKYTLRISPKISDYLSWKTKDAGQRKADWLRQMIKETMNKDQKYQQFLGKKFKSVKESDS